MMFYNAFFGGFDKLTYIKDTVIDGHTCQEIQTIEYRSGLSNYHDTIGSKFTYVSGDTVFYQHKDQFFVFV